MGIHSYYSEVSKPDGFYESNSKEKVEVFVLNFNFLKFSSKEKRGNC